MDRRGGAAAASRALALEMKTFLVTVEVFDGKELVVLKTLLLLFPLGYSKREKGEGGGCTGAAVALRHVLCKTRITNRAAHEKKTKVRKRQRRWRG